MPRQQECEAEEKVREAALVLRGASRKWKEACKFDAIELGGSSMTWDAEASGAATENPLGEAMSEDLLLDCLGLPSKEALVLQSAGSDGRLTYLDYAGAPPVCRPLLEAVHQGLVEQCLGNPHSLGGGSASSISLHFMEKARLLTLQHFGLSPDNYHVVFTSGTTAALKCVAETFPWSPGSQFTFTMNAHTSLLGIRAFAPRFKAVPSAYFFHGSEPSPDLQAGSIENSAASAVANGDSAGAPTCSLFAAPGECNFSGQVLDLAATSDLLQRLNGEGHRWLWLVDAARMHRPAALGAYQPDFVSLSYYKLFGYPTGIGALIVKKAVMPLLRKRYFGGGTLLAGAADSLFSVPRSPSLPAHFEDGTPNFHGIAAIDKGFALVAKLGGIERIAVHCHQLLLYLITQMKSLVHTRSSLPLCVFYSSAEPHPDRQGPIVTFNLQWSDGLAVGFYHVQRLAAQYHIQLRTGCFCNLGGCQEALHLSAADVAAHFALGRVCSGEASELDVINNKHTGACRVSLGYGSTREDCDVLLSFLRECFLDRCLEISLPLPTISAAGYASSSIHEEDLFWRQDVVSFPSLLSPSEATDEHAVTPVSGNVQLRAMYVYPIKSCAGIRVDQWPVTRHGLLFDRWYALVNERTGAVVTQKQCPRLALVTPTVLFDGKSWLLQISATGCATVLQVPLMSDEGSAVEINVCGRCAQGRRVCKDASQWFADYIHGPGATDKVYSLVRSDALQEQQPQSTPRTFANTAQYLLLSVQSVRALISKMQQEREEEGGEGAEHNLSIRVENFRPNLVVSTIDDEAHQEDRYRSLTGFLANTSEPHKPARFQVTGPCARCIMVNVNSSNGKIDCKVLEALKTYRYADRSIYFGQFVSLDDSSLSCLAEHGEDVRLLPRLHVGTSLDVQWNE